MIEVAYSTSFKRAFRRTIGDDIQRKKRYLSKLSLFRNNPFDKQLRTHKLSGRLASLWSFTVEHDLRIIFFFENESKAIFVNIGTHDDVY
jgi:addiction module RelE/StbE family toxin